MLEQLFGSSTRVRLLRLFFHSKQEAFFVRELTRKIGAQINAVRNELDNLSESGLLKIVKSAEQEESPGNGRSAQQRKYYALNPDALIYPELKALFLKSRVLLERDFLDRLMRAGSISYLALMGFFVAEEGAPIDIMVVGKVSNEKVAHVVRNFERDVGRELNFTVMTPQEYRYRREITDRFLFTILDAKKIVVVDTVTERAGALSKV